MMKILKNVGVMVCVGLILSVNGYSESGSQSDSSSIRSMSAGAGIENAPLIHSGSDEHSEHEDSNPKAAKKTLKDRTDEVIRSGDIKRLKKFVREHRLKVIATKSAYCAGTVVSIGTVAACVAFPFVSVPVMSIGASVAIGAGAGGITGGMPVWIAMKKKNPFDQIDKHTEAADKAEAEYNRLTANMTKAQIKEILKKGKLSDAEMREMEEVNAQVEAEIQAIEEHD